MCPNGKMHRKKVGKGLFDGLNKNLRDTKLISSMIAATTPFVMPLNPAAGLATIGGAATARALGYGLKKKPRRKKKQTKPKKKTIKPKKTKPKKVKKPTAKKKKPTAKKGKAKKKK